MTIPLVPWNYTLRNGNVAETMEKCLNMLKEQGIPHSYTPDDGSLWCNATYDTVLCWPPTPANTSITLPCPPLKGLDASIMEFSSLGSGSIVKHCDVTGRWMGKTPGHYENPWGWTNFTVCFKIDYEDVKNITKWCHASGRWLGRTMADTMNSKSSGWTNFSMCFSDEVTSIMNNLNNESLTIAQDVARNARKLEFIGLGLSLFSLIISIFIFSYYRRLRVFRNMLHLHLMIAILMVVAIRLILYIDLIFTDHHGPHANPSDGKTINTMPFVCEAMYFLLEYFKTVAFGWMFLEGFHLHNQLVLTVFNSEPKLTPYLMTAYGVPAIHTMFWLLIVLIKKDFKVERCLGSYYLEPEFWILDGPRMLELVINTFFIGNVLRVLWSKAQDANEGEAGRMMKSVKAAFMLVILLGIPNIMQTIPFAPTRDNIMIFAIWTYSASFTYMYQGFLISIIYCFTNKEVRTVLRTSYERYKMMNTSQSEMRRGSRSLANNWATKKNGQLQQANSTMETNEASKLSPYTPRSKKGSGDSTTKLMYTAAKEEHIINNNGYGSACEIAPLKSTCSCDDVASVEEGVEGVHTERTV